VAASDLRNERTGAVPPTATPPPVGPPPTAPPTRRRPSLDDEEEFSYPSLVNRWRRERSTTTLTKMDGDFYERFDRYLRTLHDDYQREQAVNPATPKVLILLDELTNLQRVRDDLYDLREKKIVTSAMIAARDGRPDRANLTKEEEALFDSVLRTLKDARLSLLRKESAPPTAQGPPSVAPSPKPAGGPPAPPDAPTAPLATPSQPAAAITDRARAVEAAPEAALPGLEVEAPRSRPDAGGQAPHLRVLVRVKAPVEPFVAPDLRHYRLQAEDVAALPREVAHVLISRGLAAPIGA